MEWITLHEAQALTQKPERTIRHLLATGRLEGKKVGKAWLVNANSLQPLCPLRAKAAEVASVAGPKEAARPENSSRNPRAFHGFKKMIELREALAGREESTPALRLLDAAMKEWVAGFFEFMAIEKTKHYRQARTLLAHLWLELEVSTDDVAAGSALQEKLTQEVIPLISGLLKRLDSRKAAKAAETSWPQNSSS